MVEQIKSDRHAGLVPASTVQVSEQQELLFPGLPPGGPRDKPGVTIQQDRIRP